MGVHIGSEAGQQPIFPHGQVWLQGVVSAAPGDHVLHDLPENVTRGRVDVV